MPFPKPVREEALVKARRHCCICHEFAGRSINVHHIEQEANGGANTLDNSIVLCLRCHAEAGHFNSKHPLGTKYAPSELIKHRDIWFKSCENGTAQLSSTVEIKVKRTFNTGALHKYALLFTFHNGNKNVVSGWKLDVLVPYKFEVRTEDIDELSGVCIDGKHYNKFQVSSTEPLFLGELCELTNEKWAIIEYSIDNEVYSSVEAEKLKVIWSFYSSSEPPIRGEVTWEELQEF